MVKNKDKVDKIIAIIIFLFFVFLIFQKGYMIFAYDHPKELREMNTVIFADEFSKGHNPYSVSTLDANLPYPTAMYGFLVPMVMGLLYRLIAFLPLSILQICELLTLMVEIAGVLLASMTVYRRTHSMILSGSGG